MVKRPLVRPRLAFVGPKPQAPGGIAQFASNLVLAVEPEADTKVVAFRRLYPKWTKPGRLASDPTAVGATIEATESLLPWAPWTWRQAVAELRAFHPDLVVVQWWHPVLGPC